MARKIVENLFLKTIKFILLLRYSQICSDLLLNKSAKYFVTSLRVNLSFGIQPSASVLKPTPVSSEKCID